MNYMLMGFFILHRENKSVQNSCENSMLPRHIQATFSTCLREMHFGWLMEGERLSSCAGYEIYRGVRAYQFLVEVICGLHSPVIGETEVFGQFKTFLQNTTLDYPLSTLLSHAVVDTKKVRSQHLKDLGGQSYGSLLRKLVRRERHVHFIGAGSFVGDLLPWMYKDDKTVSVHARDLVKARQKFASPYSRLNFHEMTASITKGVVVIAAPVDAQTLEALITNKKVKVIDLRGESQKDPCRGFSDYHTLAQFFDVIQYNQQKVLLAKAQAVAAIDDFSQQRLMVESFRPFGWEDICVW